MWIGNWLVSLSSFSVELMFSKKNWKPNACRWRFQKTNVGNFPNLLEFYYEFRFSLLSSSESTSLGPSFGEKNYDISLDQNLKTFNEDNERVQKEVSYIFLKLLQMESLYLFNVKMSSDYYTMLYYILYFKSYKYNMLWY